jgi:flagellar basal body-associated protein FliL
MPTVTKVRSKAPPSSRTGIIFSAILVALLGLGAWFWIAYRSGPGVSAEGNRAVKSSLHLEPFVLNLADREPRSYLRVGIDLGLGRELGKGENASPVGPVRDAIVGVLAQSQVDALLTVKGKAKLKEDLLQALQERVPGLEVEEVYFTEFLIQR